MYIEYGLEREKPNNVSSNAYCLSSNVCKYVDDEYVSWKNEEQLRMIIEMTNTLQQILLLFY